jgi:hypothetical protein
MYYVNYSNPNTSRVPKTSALVFSEIIKTRAMPAKYLQITREISGNVTNNRTSEYSPTTTPSSAAGWKEIYFNYFGILAFILLLQVTYNGDIRTITEIKM